MQALILKLLFILLIRHCLLTCKIKQRITLDHSMEFCVKELKLDMSEYHRGFGFVISRLNTSALLYRITPL